MLSSVSFLVYLASYTETKLWEHIRPGGAPLFYKFIRDIIYIYIFFILQSRATNKRIFQEPENRNNVY